MPLGDKYINLCLEEDLVAWQTAKALHIFIFFCKMRSKRYAMVQFNVSFWYYPLAPCIFSVHVRRDNGMLRRDRIQRCPARGGVTFQ